MPTIGETLAGRFRIDGSLGAGGMATVYRARDLRLDRDVAVKVLAQNLAGDPLLSERFDREARALAAISHPNVVTIYDVEPGDPASGREPFFVMELCEGGSLADRLLRAGGHLPPNELVPIIASIAGALDAVHSAGLVHRDVKPHNVLLASDRARLADLGLARPGDDAGWDALTTTGMAMGTLAYIAPERLAGEPATPAGDVWSLGAMTYQALTGRLPRGAATVTELAERRLAPSPPPSSANPELGTAFDEPLLASLDPDPSRRPRALAFGAALVTALGRWSRDVGSTVTGSRLAVRDTNRSTPPPPDVAVDSDAHTSVYPTHPAPGPAAASGSRRTRPGKRAGIAIIALALLEAILIVLVLMRAIGLPGPALQTPSTAPEATSPSASPSRSPTASPTPTATRDAFAEARARLADVRTAIEAARGSGGLKGKDANELQDLADTVDEAIRARDEDKAREAAGKLVEEVRKDIKDGDVSGDRARDLLAAAEALRDAIP